MVDLTGGVLVPIGAIGTLVSLAIYVGRKTQSIEAKVSDIPRIAKLTEEHCIRITKGEWTAEELRREIARIDETLREHLRTARGEL